MATDGSGLSLGRKIGFSLLVLCAFFVVAELGLRLLTTGSLYLFESNPHYADEQRIVRLTPGADTWWYGLHYQVNQMGFRMTREVGRKQGLRVLAIGDSITEGRGVRRTEEVWPQVLEELAHARGFEALESINSGVQSWNLLNIEGERLVSGQFTRFLAESAPALEPDIVIYAICLNDTPSAIHQAFELDNLRNRQRFSFFPERYREWFKRKAMYRLVRDSYRESRFRSLDFSGAPAPPAAPELWQAVSDEIGEMKRLVENMNAALYAVIVPYSYQLLPQNEAMLELNQRWHRALEANGVPYRDITSSLDPDGVLDYFALGDYIHLNARGHATVAQAALTLIEPRLEQWASQTSNRTAQARPPPAARIATHSAVSRPQSTASDASR